MESKDRHMGSYRHEIKWTKWFLALYHVICVVNNLAAVAFLIRKLNYSSMWGCMRNQICTVFCICIFVCLLQLNCMPLALLLPPGPAKAHHQLNLVYQFWVHSEVRVCPISVLICLYLLIYLIGHENMRKRTEPNNISTECRCYALKLLDRTALWFNCLPVSLSGSVESKGEEVAGFQIFGVQTDIII